MKKLIVAMSFLIQIFIFNGCSQKLDGLDAAKKLDISNLLRIEQVNKNHKCVKIPIYAEPKIQRCTKSMSKDECLKYMAKKSMQVRHLLRKQIAVCKAINTRYHNTKN